MIELRGFFATDSIFLFFDGFMNLDLVLLTAGLPLMRRGADLYMLEKLANDPVAFKTLESTSCDSLWQNG
jgi:hypothetical protein